MISPAWIRSFSIFALAASTALAPLSAQSAATPTSEEATPQIPSLGGLDAYIEQALKEWQVPGAAVVIVKNDQVVYAKGFGVREIGKAGQVDPDTIFAIGSATKAFTGAALGMLVDDKKISWDGAVHGYMPAFELSDAYATRNATVRDLLSHRTGFNSGYGWLWTGSGFDRDEIIHRLRFQTDSFGFRDHFAYANEIYTAAGELVPAVTGVSWDDFVAKRIFTPLGMSRSHTSVTALSGLENVARPHGLVDGKLVTFPYRQVDNVGGAGAINSSARDMAQWLRLQLNDGVHDGTRLLSTATLDETHSGQTIPRQGLTNPGGQFAEYGFGWIINDYRGKKVVQHSGGVDGMLCIVSMIPEEKLGVVVLTNMLPSQLTTSVELKVFDTFLGGVATDWTASLKAKDDAAKAEQERVRLAQAAEPHIPPTLPLARYAGTYTSALYGTIKVAMDSRVLTLVRPTASARLAPDKANRFMARWASPSLLSVYGETPVGFTIGPDGDVISLELGPDRFERDRDVVDVGQ